MQDGVSAIVDSNGVLDEKQFKKTTILCSYCNAVVTIFSLSLSLSLSLSGPQELIPKLMFYQIFLSPQLLLIIMAHTSCRTS